MTKKLLSTLIASLFAAAPALAQSDDDPMRVEGSATLGGIYNNQNAKDTAKLEEYQDLGNGALSNVGVAWPQQHHLVRWLRREFRPHRPVHVPARRHVRHLQDRGVPQRDAAQLSIRRPCTPYFGTGGNVLVAAFPQINPNTWNSFNQGYERKDAGGYFEWQKNSPWYFRADGNEVTFSGTKVGSGANGTSPGNGFVDLAIPVQYQDEQLGCRRRLPDEQGDVLAALGLQQVRQLERHAAMDQPVLRRQPARHDVPAAGQHVQQVHRDRQLPRPAVAVGDFRAVHVGRDQEQHQRRPERAGLGRRVFADVARSNTFNGDYVNQSFALGWTAAPVTNVETRAYYYWTRLDEQFGRHYLRQFADAAAVQRALAAATSTAQWIPTQIVGNCENDLFSYRKNNIGFDVWWRFAKNQRLGFGYDYLNLDQDRVDYDKMHWNKLWVEYKNTMLDTLTGRLKYQYLKRDATLNYSNTGMSPNDPNYLLPYTSAFDMQSSTTNQVKLYLDYSPLPLLGFSFEGNWAKQDFDDATYGRINVPNVRVISSMGTGVMPAS